MSSVAQFWAEQFVDDSNNPFAGVKVYHYEAGTTTTLDVYVDRAKTTVANQPVQGDSKGVVFFYGDGLYRIRVTTNDDILLYDWDNVDISPHPLSLSNVDDCETGMVPVYVGPNDEFECDFVDLAFVNGCLPIANCGTGTDDTPSNGTLLIGNSTGGYTVATLTAGAGISITNASGEITIATGSVEEDNPAPYSSIGQKSSVTATNIFTLSATQVTLTTTDGAHLTLTSPANLQCNVTTAGPVINGRDQSSAFTANSWIHFYWIYDEGDETADPVRPATLASIASTAAPPTGPTFPTNYTYWCYAGTVRYNSSAQLVETHINGSWAYYDASVRFVTEASVTTTEQQVTVADQVPSLALRFQFNVLFGNSLVIGTGILLKLRYMTGKDYSLMTTGEQPEGDSQVVIVPNVDQRVYWATNVSSPPKFVTMDMQGYECPNNGN